MDGLPPSPGVGVAVRVAAVPVQEPLLGEGENLLEAVEEGDLQGGDRAAAHLEVGLLRLLVRVEEVV